MNNALIRFISKRQNSPSVLPRSIRAMRRVSIVGIAMTIAALVVAVSVGAGFEREYVKALLDFNSHIIVASAGEIMKPDEIMEKLKSISADDESRIVEIEPFIYREALAIGSGKIQGVIVKGVSEEYLSGAEGLAISKFPGAFDDKSIALYTGKGLYDYFDEPSGLDMMIPGLDDQEFVDVRVAGTFESGIHDFDAEFVLAGLRDVRKLFGIEGESITGFEIRIEDPLKAGIAAEKIEETLGPLYETTTWEELNGELLRAVRLERLVSAMIMGLMVFVALLNIIAVMVLITIYRLKNIAIFRTLGLTRSGIAQVFVRAGMSIVAGGVIAGFALGILISIVVDKFDLIPLDPSVYLIDALPVDISPVICGMLAIFCIVLGYLTSYVAAHKLADTKIVDGLNTAR